MSSSGIGGLSDVAEAVYRAMLADCGADHTPPVWAFARIRFLEHVVRRLRN